ALKYWNRTDQPRIRDVQLDPQTRWDPILADRTLGVARATTLELSAYRLARRRLDASGAFTRYSLDLRPAEGDEYDLNLRAADRSGLHPVSWLRGLPYQTVSPELINVRGRAINLQSLLRWDSNKQRVFAEVSAPAGISTRYKVSLDFRD